VTDQIPRDVLPIPESPHEGDLPLDAKDPEATFPPIAPLKPRPALQTFWSSCSTTSASLLAKEGKPTYCYDLLGLQRFKIEANSAIRPGTHQVRMEFAYDGGGLAKGGTVALYLDGDKVGEGRVEGTVPLVFSGDETADIGRDTASPVSDDYDGEGSVFTGTVDWVQIDLGQDAEDADHLITPEERLRVAMARQ
jgi:hypothetical protein